MKHFFLCRSLEALCLRVSADANPSGRDGSTCSAAVGFLHFPKWFPAWMALCALGALRCRFLVLGSCFALAAALPVGMASLPYGKVFAVWDASPSREEALIAHSAASQWADIRWEEREGFKSPETGSPYP